MLLTDKDGLKVQENCYVPSQIQLPLSKDQMSFLCFTKATASFLANLREDTSEIPILVILESESKTNVDGVESSKLGIQAMTQHELIL